MRPLSIPVCLVVAISGAASLARAEPLLVSTAVPGRASAVRGPMPELIGPNRLQGRGALRPRSGRRGLDRAGVGYGFGGYGFGDFGSSLGVDAVSAPPLPQYGAVGLPAVPRLLPAPPPRCPLIIRVGRGLRHAAQTKVISGRPACL